MAASSLAMQEDDSIGLIIREDKPKYIDLNKTFEYLSNCGRGTELPEYQFVELFTVVRYNPFGCNANMIGPSY